MNVIICLLRLSSQAFADATTHFAGYTEALITIDQFQTVESNGNIGIGTIIPAAALSIYGLIIRLPLPKFFWYSWK